MADARISRNIAEIRRILLEFSLKAGLSGREITIIAVTKGRTAQEIKDVIACGITDIGENKVQEAVVKYDALISQRLKWHMIGHLQTNKVKEAVRIFDLIQSVDSARLAEEINRQASRINKIQDVLVEVNICAEPSRFGVSPDEAPGFMEKISALSNIRIKGLMGIAPLLAHPEESRPYFRILRELFVKINGLNLLNYEPRILSMGMSDDFTAAIEEGANMIRLGRAIFSCQ